MEMTKEYITLRDLLFGTGSVFAEEEAIEQDLDLGVVYKDGNDYLLKLFLEYNFEEATIESIWNDNYTNTLFCTYIYPRYSNMVIAQRYQPTDGNQEFTIKRFIRLLMNRIKTSYDENKLLIDILETNKNKLMDDVKSNSQNKYNDTPQTTTTSGQVSYDDTYNTNVSTTYNTSEVATKIARIAEIENYIKDYYERWANGACMGLFIYE